MGAYPLDHPAAIHETYHVGHQLCNRGFTQEVENALDTKKKPFREWKAYGNMMQFIKWIFRHRGHSKSVLRSVQKAFKECSKSLEVLSAGYVCESPCRTTHSTNTATVYKRHEMSVSGGVHK